MNDRVSPPATPGAQRSARSVLPSGERQARLRQWRKLKDGMARYAIGTFGIGVIACLALIFVYLFSEVIPMFRPAQVAQHTQYAAPGADNPAASVHLAANRHRSLALRLTDDGRAVFFDPGTGTVTDQFELPLPEGLAVTARARAEPRNRLAAYGLEDGRVLLARYVFDEAFSDGQRHVSGSVDYPVEVDGDPLLDVAGDGTAVRTLAVQRGSQGISLAAELADGRLVLVRFEERTNFLTGEVQVEQRRFAIERPADVDITQMLLDATGRTLLLGDADGRVHYYDISRPDQPHLRDSRRVLRDPEAAVTAMEYLLGTVSLIVGGSDGSVNQWFLVRDQDNIGRLTYIRGFESHAAPVTTIVPEYARKGFVTGDSGGAMRLHFATSERTLSSFQVGDGPLRSVSFGPRANALYAVDERERLHVYSISNPHPEVSFSALWQQVWYEGRSKPEYVWQSSSATDEFEPKFSLVPLTLGTIKAAFYAMLFAVPLAILAAIYSAYFMSPRLRGYVKPSIEIMEALPTVILGFLAGLWLAPYVESNLPAVFSILVFTPLFMILFGLLWTRLVPLDLRSRIPPGWEAALLVPVLLLVGWASVSLSPAVEVALFGGDARQWLTDVGITYDQRNALVVGMAMGFAVIPTIYSISEDAIFNVPKHLTQGSLALGATPWQTMTRVVLLTASPGIFSAVMIGMGRAVGETMIVLMATGNSPVMNFNIFEGMRTLSANIAVEMTEAAAGGTHYRILFLAALVLFVLTFFMNTLAEIVRHRLRLKYSSL